MWFPLSMSFTSSTHVQILLFFKGQDKWHLLPEISSGLPSLKYPFLPLNFHCICLYFISTFHYLQYSVMQLLHILYTLKLYVYRIYIILICPLFCTNRGKECSRIRYGSKGMPALVYKPYRHLLKAYHLTGGYL